MEKILNTYICLINEPVIVEDLIYMAACVSFFTFKLLSAPYLGLHIYDYLKKRKCQ